MYIIHNLYERTYNYLIYSFMFRYQGKPRSKKLVLPYGSYWKRIKKEGYKLIRNKTRFY